MKVWGVRNFYSNLEHRSEEGSEFSLGYFALVIASTLLATGGLLANSVPVIVGSMCIAPFLDPSRAVCVGGVYKKWKTVGKGLTKQLSGLLAIGPTIAFLVTIAFLRLTPEIIVTPEVMARVSGPWQELLDVMIGAEIAISLIPPASVVGIGLAFGRFDVFLHSLGLLMINVLGLDIIGSIPVLYLWGLGFKPLQLEKKIRKITEKTIKDVVKADEISAEVVLHSYKKADVHVSLHTFEIHDRADRLLAKRISQEIKQETGVSNNVRIIIVPVRMYTS